VQVQRGWRRTSQDRVRADHRPPNIFARDITKPSVEFKDPAEPGPSNAGPSGGNPPADEAEPMNIDFETSSTGEAEAMEIDEAPTLQDWRA